MNITLNNVRLSFPHIFTPQEAKEAGGKPKYNAAFLIEKSTQGDLIVAIQVAIEKVATAKWPKGIPNSVRGEKICLRDGATKDHDGYDASVMFLTASSPVMPTVVNRNRTPLTEADGVIFAGCYVNVIVEIWAQDNSFGKRVNASLKAIQFYADGEPFGDKPVTPDAFADLDSGSSATAPDPSDAYADENADLRKPGSSMF